MKKVLVTGANGLIARKISTFLPEFTTEVMLTSRSQSIPGVDGNFLSCDIRDFDTLQQLLESFQPDMVIHTAAVTSIDYAELHPQETKEVNVVATENLAKWCGQNNARLIYFSSDFVFDGTGDFYDETDEPNPVSLYGRSKLQSEKAVERWVPDHVIIRPVLVYGLVPDMARLNFPLWVATKLSEGSKAYITGDQYRTPTYVDDVAMATLKVAFSEFTGLLHVSGEEQLSIMDFARKTAQAFELDESLLVEVNTSELNQVGKRPLRTGFTNERLKSLIDYQPTSIEQALQKMRQTDI